MCEKVFCVETLDGSCPLDANWRMSFMTRGEIAKLLVRCIQNRNDLFAVKIGEWFFCKKTEGQWFSPEWDHRFDYSIY